MNIEAVLQEKQQVTAIIRLIEEVLREVRTISLGEVIGFDADKQRADVKIILKDFVGEEIEEITTLKDVPVLNYGILSIFTTLPIQSGDLGLILFSDRSIDEIDNGFSEVRDNRTHDISDGLFIPLPIRYGSEVIKQYDKDCFEIRNKERDELLIRICPKTKEVIIGFTKDKKTLYLKKDKIELLTNNETTKILIEKERILISVNGTEKIEINENGIILKGDVTIDGNLSVSGLTTLKNTTINGIPQKGD